MIVGLKAWEALPKEYQNIFTAACGESNSMAMAKYDFLNPGALKKLIAGGAQLRSFPRPVLDACYKAAHEQYADWSAKVPEFKTMYASYSKFLADELAWFRVAEGSYDGYMATAAQTAARKG
jgi:TRAP-type mannitol/chloroaromatic compound transport system substrate-binding protein